MRSYPRLWRVFVTLRPQGDGGKIWADLPKTHRREYPPKTRQLWNNPRSCAGDTMADLPAFLPDDLPRHEWRDVGPDTHGSVLAEFENRVHNNVRLDDGFVVVDYCYFPGAGERAKAADGKWRDTPAKPHSYKVVEWADHPFLAALEETPHVPRSVKHLYRAATRFRRVIATEALDYISDWNRAEKDWREFLANRNPEKTSVNHDGR